MNTYLGQGTRVTPQSEAIPGSNQVPNSAGGYSFPVDDWKRLERFLILGSERGTFYIKQAELTKENSSAVRRCIETDGHRVVRLVLEISEQGRAVKQDPGLFVLAMCAGARNSTVRQAALDSLPRIARTGTSLFHFLAYAETFRGWGRAMRRGVSNWYNSMPADKLGYQTIKYQQRDGWSHHDLLHLAHVKPVDQAHNSIYAWAKTGKLDDYSPSWLIGFAKVQAAENAGKAAQAIYDYKLPREAVPTQFMNDQVVWEALLDDMPMTALIRNLATMTKIGLIAPFSDATSKVVAQLGDSERLRKSRVHPMSILFALKTYEQGHGEKSDAKWSPVGQVVDALDSAFYESFVNVEPSGKRLVLALDVSGSMTSPIAGTAISCREAAAAMALVTARTEPNYSIVAFSCSSDSGVTFQNYRQQGSHNKLVPVSISPRQRLDDVVKQIGKIPMGGTDCALPMLVAMQNNVKADAFVEYTDSETWANAEIHPSQALQKYREKSGINARMVVCGMTSNGFSVADQNDAGQLDVVGFDPTTPQVISDFVSGKL